MSEIRPFAALRFARDAGPRIAPPYDVIDKGMRAALAAEPENVVHLTLPPGEEGERDYEAAARTLRAWIAGGVLVRDTGARIYALEERIAGGRRRRGLLAALRLYTYAERVVLPHERTMEGPKHDRLLLTRAVQANLEPLFFLYEDRAQKLRSCHEIAARNTPLVECEGPDGTGLTLRALSDRPTIEELVGFLAERPVIVADGHHRYETMLAYREERREAARLAGVEPVTEAPHEFVLAYLVNAFDPGSAVRAIHRILRGVRAEAARAALRACGFAVEPLDIGLSPERLLDELRVRAETAHAFAWCTRDARWLSVRPRSDALDVEVLHGELLPRLAGELSFDADLLRGLGRVSRGEADFLVVLNPIPPAALFEVVQAGRVLPQKSTYFSPKIPSGLVLREL
jgi:uncharacterized protein (DUF1015 family)